MTENKKHYNIVICTPGSNLMSNYVASLVKTIDYFNENNISYLWSNRYASHVGDAREVTVGGPDPQEAFNSTPFKGEFTYDMLMWIDSDIAWEPEQIMKLYNSDKDIVSGMYLLSDGSVTAYPELFGPALYFDQVINRFDLFEVTACGFGFLGVKKGIFESLSRPWFQAVIKGKKSEDGEEFLFPLMGEDMSWCVRAKEAGYNIWVDPTVRVTHHKTMKLTWNGVQP